ncbi:hypothetical protein BB559_000720 [Furculomyces boomerangus]|uniref:Uncharacterized protein n=1 Tax=Furculomyces boomerangus TaxID=61424 RepID=A0A2T9YDQ4_9FUNG|nr:hypothetical protein BB559_004618 [Furculomyces boomerangus]PVU99435.1 hypothetical protein BB559_000720 [Furculomyces boomerangus]
MAQGIGMLIVYVAGWGLVFGTFVHYYHKRKALALKNLESYFPEHKTRDVYYQLVTLQSENPSAVSTPMLQSALIRRAVDDVLRAVSLQTNKSSLQSLVNSGAIPQDLLHQFNSAEAELETEMLAVKQEADSLVEGMGEWIFQVGSEVLSNARQRELREQILKLEVENLNCIGKLGKVEGADYNKVNKIQDSEREKIISELIDEEASKKQLRNRNKTKSKK